MRPMYETELDREHEQEIVEHVCKCFDVIAKKMPIRYEFDYALMKKPGMDTWDDFGAKPRMVGILEIKRRLHKYKTLILSQQKVATMQTYSGQFEMPAILVVAWPDEEPHYTILHQKRTATYRIEWGGRIDRGDDQDEEPVIHIPVEHFQPVSSQTREVPT